MFANTNAFLLSLISSATFQQYSHVNEMCSKLQQSSKQKKINLTPWRNDEIPLVIISCHPEQHSAKLLLAPCPCTTVNNWKCSACMEWNFKCSWPTFLQNELCVCVWNWQRASCTTLGECRTRNCSTKTLRSHVERSTWRHPPSAFHSYSRNKLSIFLSATWKTTVFGIVYRIVPYRIAQWTSAPKLLLNLICWICKVELVSCEHP